MLGMRDDQLPPFLWVCSDLRSWALLGLRDLPEVVADRLDGDASAELRRLRRAILMHLAYGDALTRAQVEPVAEAVNAGRIVWPMPRFGPHVGARDLSGLDVPALWGMQAASAELWRGRERPNRARHLVAAERLCGALAAAIGPPYAARFTRPSLAAVQAAWIAWQRASPLLLIATAEGVPPAPRPGPFRPRLVPVGGDAA